MATITELHVGWSETASLPDYNNVKPSVSLTIHLSEHDDPDRVLDSGAGHLSRPLRMRKAWLRL